MESTLRGSEHYHSGRLFTSFATASHRRWRPPEAPTLLVLGNGVDLVRGIRGVLLAEELILGNFPDLCTADMAASGRGETNGSEGVDHVPHGFEPFRQDNPCEFFGVEVAAVPHGDNVCRKRTTVHGEHHRGESPDSQQHYTDSSKKHEEEGDSFSEADSDAAAAAQADL